MARSLRITWRDDKVGEELFGFDFGDNYLNVSTIVSAFGLGYKLELNVPLLEPIALEFGSSFEPISDLIPGVSIMRVVDFAKKATRGLAGVTTRGLQTFDLQVWKSTEPIKFQAKIKLYTRTNPRRDVLLPYISLASLSILTETARGSGVFVIPGINLANLNAVIQAATSEAKTASFTEGESISGLTDKAAAALVSAARSGDNIDHFFNAKAKICELHVGGTIHLFPCVLLSVRPTIAIDPTESGPPLWLDLDCQFQTVYPASDEMLLKILDYEKPDKPETSSLLSLLGV